ncbi:hypothetical protein PB01_05220 [Psychrobacillus glaciei]|uniref:Uncharacterized protein n=1 Tax=Psychrobacillus glaciei TaxID=2283160 RepID=A0A5J6SJV6_9BACI|nr:hypothetical protein [Psychrobacillus glaciei]QFF98266.1 hypothetical protein PB01_05220 [Psychrobacillus glaciei]
MGYILPIQPIQSQIYANRLLMDHTNFAVISNINGIRMKSIFDERLEEEGRKVEKKDEKQRLANENPSSLPLFKSFIQPNPVNLSPKIAEICGKGNRINYYI